MAETLMRVEEAARYVKLSASTLNKLRIRGGGPHYRKLGHAVRYAPSDIADWLRSHERSSTSAQADGNKKEKY